MLSSLITVYVILFRNVAIGALFFATLNTGKLLAQESLDRIDISTDIYYRSQPIFNPVGGFENSGSILQGLWLQFKLGKGINKNKAVWTELDHWSIVSRLAIVRGDGNYYQQIGAAYPLQTMTSSGQWLTEASITREPGEGNLLFKAGIFTLNPEFMDSNIFNNYVNSAINDTFNDEVLGVPIAPLAATGVMLGYGNAMGSKYGILKLGAFGIMPTNQFGVSYSAKNPIPYLSGGLAIVQWEKQFNSKKILSKSTSINSSDNGEALPMPGIMIGGYWSKSYTNGNGSSYQTINVPVGENRTIYGSIILPLESIIPSSVNSRIWLAGRIGLDTENNPAPSYAGIGLLRQGLIPGRPGDVTGIAAVTTGFSQNITPGTTQESVIEFNHRIRISSKINIKPFVQLIINPGGTGDLSPILAPGVEFSASIW